MTADLFTFIATMHTLVERSQCGLKSFVLSRNFRDGKKVGYCLNIRIKEDKNEV